MSDKRKIVNTIGWSLLAGATGAAVALLLAPQSGRRTRRDLRKLKGHVIDRLADFQEDLHERVVEIVDDLEERVQKTTSPGALVSEEWLRPLHATKELLDQQIQRAEKFFQRKTSVH